MRFEQDMTLREKLARLSPQELEVMLQRLASAGLSDHGGVEDSGHDPAVVAPGNDIYPATYAQILFWRQYDTDRGGSNNHQSMEFRIHGALDVEALKSSFQILSKSQPSLRTVYFEDDLDVWQHIKPSLPIPLGLIDTHAVLDMEEFLKRPFALESDPPIRVRLIKESDNVHLLQIVMHHIASDGRSKVVLLQELSEHYNALKAGQTPVAKIHATSLGRKAHEEREWLCGSGSTDATRHWEGSPFGEGLQHPWPTGRHRVSDLNPDAEASGRLDLDLGVDLSRKVRAFAAERGMTPLQLMMGCYLLCLQRLVPGSHVTVAMPVDIRGSEEEASLVGCLMNVVPVTMDAEPTSSIDAYLSLVLERITKAVEHARMPLYRILEIGHESNRTARTLSWKTLVNFKEDYADSLSLNGLTVETLPYRQLGSGVDISLTFQRTNGDPGQNTNRLTAHIDVSKISLADASALLMTWRSVISQCIHGQVQSIDEIDILLPGERERILELSGRGDTTDYPENTLYEIFRQTVERFPDRPAVIEADGRETTYEELRVQAHKVAVLLRAKGIKRGDIVAVHIQRSFRLLASVMGIMESGAAFLLLEKSLPIERLLNMLDHAKASAVLSERCLPALSGYQDVTFDVMDLEDAEHPSRDVSSIPSDSRDLAYVMFTSGSTGIPKGVMVEHRNLVHYLENIRHSYAFGPGHKTLMRTLVSFDACLIELLLPLFSGGSVVMAEEGTEIDMSVMTELIANRNVSHLFCVPSILRFLLDDTGRAKIKGILKTIVSGGESFQEALMRDCQDALDLEVFQDYGPTEATVAVTFWKYEIGHGHPHPPIGKPNKGVIVMVMDALGRQVPPGMSGELWIGGAQTGRGYIHNPEETKKRFVVDPIEPGSGRRYYRTGDLARFLPDGNLLFLGRIDDQAKVRGVRIETGDVAAALLRCEGVREAIVLHEPDGAGSQRLRAWVTLQKDCTSGEAEIRSILARMYPTYMVPFRIHVVDTIPLTPHGKTDHRALRLLAEQDAADMDTCLPLATESQRRLAALWSQLLGVEVRHRDADFFCLGGHSLLAMRLAARIRQELGTQLSLSDFYADGRLEVIAQRIDAVRDAEPFRVTDLPPLVPGERIPMSAAQRRMWMLQQLLEHPSSYHISLLTDIPASLGASEVKDILLSMADRHAILRTRLWQDDEGFWQEALSTDAWQLDWAELFILSPADESRAMSEERERPFELSDGPGWRARWIVGPASDPLLLLVFHHALVDEWSMNLLRRELSERLGGAPSEAFVRPAFTYADFARWQQWANTGAGTERLETYWKDRLSGMGEPVRILPDMSRPDATPGRSALANLDIGEPLRALMDAFVRREGISRFAAWMAVWQILQARLGSGGEVLLATPVSERAQPEWLDVVGMCLNTLPIRARVDEQASFRAFSREGHRVLAADIAHAQLPYEDILRVSDLDLGPDTRGLPQVMFVMHGKHEWQESDERSAAKSPKSRFAKNPLTIHLTDRQDLCRIALEFDADRFRQYTAEAILTRFEIVARQVLSHPDIRISEIDILLPGERQRIRQLSGRDNIAPYPQTTLHAIFRNTAHRYPERPAVIGADGTETSYTELQVQVTRVAACLRSLGIAKEDVVAVHLQRSPALLASMLGILEAGGAFLLLEPSLPLDRLRAIAGQARVRHILSEDGMPLVPGFEDATIRYNDIQDAHTDIGTIPTYASDPSDLACVIFTSGSTGVPKGAMLEHRNLTNYLYSVLDLSDLSAELRTLQKTLLSFDLSLFEWLLPMVGAGSAIIPEPEKLLDFDHLAELAARHRASHAFFAPAQLKGFLESPHIRDAADTLRFISCGGESMPEHLMRTYLETLSSKLFHIYGPAECAVWVSRWESYSDLAHPKPPIGTPNANVDLLIIDALGRPAPPGMPGEIWIGGKQTGRGYIHNEEETKRRFVDDPIEPGSGRRYYRTGDLAQFLPDGNLLFLGRIDDQVKVRGVRIELGDVSAGLLRCEGVCEAVVLPEPDGEGSQRLRAWITLQQECTSDETEIRSALAGLLPMYMVPFRIHVVDTIPLTPHGKTDHRALRLLAEQDAGDIDAGLPLETETQLRLAVLWSELLETTVQHRDADFFRLGGHSLNLMRLQQRIQTGFGTRMPLQRLLQSPVLQDMSDAIARMQADGKEQPSEDGRALLIWDADGSGAQYFCGGGLGDNHELVSVPANRFGWTWKVFHIPDPEIRAGEMPSMPMEQLAKAYANIILSIHREGPIVLSGICMNGIDAHATACHLQQQERFPVHLVLFDTRQPSEDRRPALQYMRHKKADSPNRWLRWLRPLHKLFHSSKSAYRSDTPNDIDTLSRIGAKAVRQGILDPEWYLRLYLDVATAGVDPVIHYLAEGWKEGRLPSPWFHVDSYAILEPRFREEEPDPVRHFLAHGIRRYTTNKGIQNMAAQWPLLLTGDIPHRVFDPTWYLRRYPGVADSWLPPLPYFIVHGARELCYEPSLHFNAHTYASIAPDFDRHRHNPVLHYLLKGRYDPDVEKAVGSLTAIPDETARLIAAGWFDPEWYTARYPGTPFLGSHPLNHYMALGWKYERKPFAAYDPESFSKSFPDFMPDRMNPLRFLLQQAKLPERHAPDKPGTVEMKEETDTYPDISSATSTHEPVLASDNTDLEKRTGEGPHRKLETQIESFIWQGIQNRLSYRPARFNGTLHILSNQHQFDDDPTLGWKDGLHGKIRTYRLYGDHESYHRDELQANAAIINDLLTHIFKNPPEE